MSVLASLVILIAFSIIVLVSAAMSAVATSIDYLSGEQEDDDGSA